MEIKNALDKIKNMTVGEIFRSKGFKALLTGFGIALAASLIFQAGLFVGYHKAGFSYRMGENYFKTFEGRNRDGFLPRMPGMPGLDRNLTGANGTIGKIIKIDLPVIVVADRDNVEKSVLLLADTAIRKFRDELRASDLKVDDFVVIFGSSNSESQIEAKLIRLMPAAENTNQTK